MTSGNFLVVFNLSFFGEYHSLGIGSSSFFYLIRKKEKTDIRMRAKVTKNSGYLGDMNDLIKLHKAPNFN
jgi:hypothetical protein